MTNTFTLARTARVAGLENADQLESDESLQRMWLDGPPLDLGRSATKAQGWPRVFRALAFLDR